MAANPGHGDAVPSPRTGIVGAVALAVFITALDIADGPSPAYVGLLIGPPFLAAAFAGHRATLSVGALCTACGFVVGFLSRTGLDHEQVIRMIAIVVATGLAAAVSTIRNRTSERVATLSKLAAVAQQAVLRPIGPQVGGLSVAVRYVSASAEADIGGDLYEALNTPYGVRLLIGDVRGKGLDAVRLASIVLGSYRHVAHERADLRAIVSDLDRAVARSVGYEDFVTAALVEERGGTLTVLNCGHPPPLLLRNGEVIALDPPSPAPPLGFLPVARPRVERLEPGDRLLLYTDGLAEARRDGEFFPIQDRAWRILGHGTVEDGLTSLENALKDWVHGVLDDDIALVLLEYTGASGAPEADTPAWEWDEALGD
jgi:sigma-B regulation protein RsbU (phosphoserine phosphatase)